MKNELKRGWVYLNSFENIIGVRMGYKRPQDIWSKFRWQIQVNVLENLTDELIYKGIECMADFLVLKLEETRGSNVSNNHFIYVY